MKQHLSLLFAAVLAVLTGGGCSPSSGFDTRGVPPDATTVFCFKFGPENSKARETFETYLGKTTNKKHEATEELKKGFGVAYDSLTEFCMFKILGKTPESEIKIGIFRGESNEMDFLESELLRDRKETLVEGVKVYWGKHGEAAFRPDKQTSVFLIHRYDFVEMFENRDSPTIAAPLAASIRRTMELLSGGEKSFQFSKEAVTLSQNTGEPFLLSYVSPASFSFGGRPPWKKSGVKNEPEKILLAVGDTNGKIRTSARIGFSQEADAQQFSGYVKVGVQAAIPYVSAWKRPANEAARKALVALKREVDGNTVSLSTELDSDEAVLLCKEIMNRGISFPF